jgi:hypothetical protein
LESRVAPPSHVHEILASGFPGLRGLPERVVPSELDGYITQDRVVDLVMLTTGSEAYRRKDGIAVVPLALLGP